MYIYGTTLVFRLKKNHREGNAYKKSAPQSSYQLQLYLEEAHKISYLWASWPPKFEHYYFPVSTILEAWLMENKGAHK